MLYNFTCFFDLYLIWPSDEKPIRIVRPGLTRTSAVKLQTLKSEGLKTRGKLFRQQKSQVRIRLRMARLICIFEESKICLGMLNRMSFFYILFFSY